MSTDDRYQSHSDEHVVELLSQTVQRVRQLVRDELRAARVEFLKNRRHLGFGGGLLGGAGVLGFVALQATTAAVIAALAEALPVWAACLIIGVAAGLGAGAAALLGKKQMEHAVPAVEETVDSVKADVAALKGGGR